MRQSIRAVLKSETAASHARAESAFESGFGLAEPRGIRRFLHCMLSAHRRFAPECNRALQIVGLDDRSVALIDALERSCACEEEGVLVANVESVAGLSECSSVQTFAGRVHDKRAAADTSPVNDDFSLGVAYVFEGSAMGAAILEKRIQASGLSVPLYLKLMTCSASTRWPRFVRSMESRSDTAQLLAGAEAVFEHLIQEANGWS